MNDTANNGKTLSFTFSLLIAVCLFFALLARFSDGNSNRLPEPASNVIVELTDNLQAIPLPVAEVPVLSFTRNFPDGPLQLFIPSLPGQASFASCQQARLEQTQHLTFIRIKPVIAQALIQGFFFPHKHGDEPVSC